MKTITNSAEVDRDEAMAWLAGALRWEQTLDDLRHSPSVEGEAVAALAAADVTTAPARRAEAA